MVLIAYTKHSSAHGQLFLTCLLEMGLEDSPEVQIKIVEWDQVLDEKHRATHPFKQLPWFEIPELNLTFTETRVALKYLAQKTGSKLVPPVTDVAATLKFEEACSWELNNFVFEAQSIGVEKYAKPTFYGYEGYNKTYVGALEDSLALSLKGYEAILSRQAFLAGDQMTLVDLFHLPHGSLVILAGGAPSMVDGSLPNVKRWWDTLTALESHKKASKVKKDQVEEMLRDGTMLKSPPGKWNFVKP